MQIAREQLSTKLEYVSDAEIEKLCHELRIPIRVYRGKDRSKPEFLLLKRLQAIQDFDVQKNRMIIIDSMIRSEFDDRIVFSKLLRKFNIRSDEARAIETATRANRIAFGALLVSLAALIVSFFT